MVVGPSSPREDEKEEMLKDEFIFPQPEPQPEPLLEPEPVLEGALAEPQPQPGQVVEKHKKKGKPWHRKPRGLAVELALQ